MADQKRNLNIPIYDATISPEGGVQGDVIDAEVFEDAPKLGERVKSRFARDAESVSGTIRNAKVNGVKDAFFTQPADAARDAAGRTSSQAHARQEGRARREEQARARAAEAADSKQARADRDALNQEAKLDPLVKLKLDTVRAGETYMDSLRRSGLLGAGETKATQRKQLSDMHQVYASMMVLQCVQPLQQGVSGQNIASVLGMGASMWMLSPNFRTQLGSFAEQVGGVIREKIEDRSTRKDRKAQGKFDVLASKGKADQLSNRWQRRLDKVEHAERGHRLPFTAQSAAMTEVALAESAYAEMRRPGVDQGAVRDQYASALSVLYGYVDDDGLDREDVSRSMRVIVGQRLEQDPALANVFSELGHGRFTKSAPREVFINGTTERATVWTGDFVDSYEGRTVSKGSFSLRPVMSVSEHRVLSAETLAAELTTATSVGDLNDTLSQYVVAASVARYPDVVDQVEDPGTRSRFGKARTMFASMAADGLSPEQQRFAYTAAYVDAVESVQRLNPDLGAEWVAQYGDQWREDVAEQMREYTDLGAEAERAKQGAGASSASTSTRGAEQRFTATADGSVRDARNPGDKAYSAEDIVDAEVVDDDLSAHAGYASSTTKREEAQVVYEGVVVDNSALPAGDDIIDGEIIEDAQELEAGQAHDSILDGVQSTSSKADYDQSVELHGTSKRARLARADQQRNEAENSDLTRTRGDAAKPSQEVDFSLG